MGFNKIEGLSSIFTKAIEHVGNQDVQQKLAGKFNKIDIDNYLAETNNVEKIEVAEYSTFNNYPSHNGTIDTVC